MHDNMVTMWVHISERGRPGAAPSQVMLMEARRHQVPNIGFSPPLKELTFIDPDSRIANENTAA